jgi:hypothetical protein
MPAPTFLPANLQLITERDGRRAYSLSVAGEPPSHVPILIDFY